jgi:hypothetical protein
MTAAAESGAGADPASDDPPVPVRLRLAALWTSVMFCYVYGDSFALYTPGKLEDMAGGSLGPLGPAGDAVLVGVSAMMAIPALMVIASLVLPRVLCRSTNLVLGLVYSAIILGTLPGSAPFYCFLGLIEIALTLTVSRQAGVWRRDTTTRRLRRG